MSEPSRSALVITFSQTGNTQQVAEAIGRGLRGRGVAVTSRDLPEARPEEVAEHDILGIGTPVFYYREPEPVKAFLARLPRARRKPAFTFITHGGNPVNTLRRMQKQLGARGYTVVNSFSCPGYDTYPMFFRVFRQWGRPNEQDLADAEAMGGRLPDECRWLTDEKRFATPKYPFVGGQMFVRSLVCRGGMMKRLFPALEVDPEVCTRCGECARTCPAGAITLDPTPTISDDCIWCYQCERICPVQAFRTDWTKLREKMGV